MARTIPHRELRNNSSAILREVQAGETIEITNHGEVVAILVPPARRPSSLPYREPRTKRRFSELPSVRIDHPVQETLDYLRGDR